MTTKSFDSAEARREMRRRHLELGLRLQRVALCALAELEAKIADRQPLNLTREQAHTLMVAGREMERQAMGGEPEAGDDAPIPPKKPN